MSSYRRRKEGDTHDTRQHFVQHSTKTPPIDLITIWKALNNLWCEILCCATERARCVCMARWPRCRELCIIFHPVWRSRDRGCTWHEIRHRATRELLGEPEVSKYDVTIGSDKDILWLEVTIDNTGGVQALDALNDFGGIEAGTITAKAAPACQLCRKIAARMEVLSR